MPLAETQILQSSIASLKPDVVKIEMFQATKMVSSKCDVNQQS